MKVIHILNYILTFIDCNFITVAVSKPLTAHMFYVSPHVKGGQYFLPWVS